MDKSKAHKFFPPRIALESLKLDEVLSSNYCFEQRLVFAVLADQTTVQVKSPKELESYPGATVKIEGMESLSREMFYACRRLGDSFHHEGPVTAHLFVGQAQSPSFPLHVDPDDIILQVLLGEKDLIVGDDVITIHPGEALFMPRNTPHQALNTKGSIMLSFGLENYTADKLSYDVENYAADKL